MPKVSVKHKTRVQEKIIQAAMKNFAKKGYSETSMDDIAKSAEVSKGGLYHHFPSKEDLFLAICKSNQQILIDTRSGLLQNKDRIRQDFGIFYDNYLKAVQQTDHLRMEALAESAHNPKLRKIIQKNRKEIEANVEAFLKQMRKSDDFFQKDVDLKALSSGILGLYDGLFLSKMVGTKHEDNKKAWIETSMAIMEGTGMKK